MRGRAPASSTRCSTTFQADPERPLWERLLAALEAGKRAGGEPNGEKSSGLYVVDREPYAMVDLRVDLHPEPVRELRRLADAYFPLVPYYNLRPCDPEPAARRTSGWRSSGRADRSPRATLGLGERRARRQHHVPLLH